MTWLDGSWDVLYIDGIRLPGRLSKFTISPKRKVEQTKPQGADNPFIKDQGYEGADVDVEIELYRAVQVEQLAEMLSNLSPRQPGAVSNPHTINHPLAVASNVTKVYVESYTVGLPNKNRMAIPIKMKEWFPEEPAKKTKQGSKTSGKAAGDGGPFASGDVPPPNPQNVGANFT